MKIALSSTWFLGDLDSFVRHCLRTDVRDVDIYCPDDIALDTLPAVRGKLTDAGLRPVCISTFVEMNRPGLAVHFAPLIVESVRVAADLGVPMVNTYFGPNAFLSQKQQVEAYLRNIAPCVVEAERHGVTLLLENGWDWYGEDPAHTELTRRAEWLLTLMNRVDSPQLRLTFDASNFLLAGEEPYPHAFEILKNYIGYVHVKDATRYSERRHGARRERSGGGDRQGPHGEEFGDAGQEFSIDSIAATGVKIWADGKSGGNDPEFVFTPLGTGAVNWHGLLCALHASGYDGWLGLEPHVVQLDDWFKAAQQAIDYLHNGRFCGQPQTV